MPLKYLASKAARESNIRKEIDSGKKPSQAVAIGYAVQNESKSHEKRESKATERKEKK